MAEATLENPVLKDLDIEGKVLLDLTEKVERGEPVEMPEVSANDPAERAAGGENEKEAGQDTALNVEVSPAKEQETTTDSRARDASGKFVKAENGATPPAAAPTKPDSEYTRKQKDLARREKTWVEINAEKDRLNAEREAIAQERAAMQQRQVQQAPDQFTSKQYHQYALDTRKLAQQQFDDGETTLAAENFALAQKAFEAAEKTRELESQTQFEQTRKGFEQQWIGNREATIKANPEIVEPGSPIARQMNEWLDQKSPNFQQMFHFMPNGFETAYQIAKWKLGADETSALREQNQQLRTELQKYQKLTSVGGSSPTRHTGPKTFNSDMPLDEMEAYLRRATENAGGIRAA